MTSATPGDRSKTGLELSTIHVPEKICPNPPPVICRVASVPLAPVPNCSVDPMPAALGSVTVPPDGISVGPAAAAGKVMKNSGKSRTGSEREAVCEDGTCISEI